MASSETATSNLGPLDSTHIAPSYCGKLTLFSTTSSDKAKATEYILQYARTCYDTGLPSYIDDNGPGPDPTCFPSIWGGFYSVIDRFNTSVPMTYPVYSPGRACPERYSAACTASRPLGVDDGTGRVTASATKSTTSTGSPDKSPKVARREEPATAGWEYTMSQLLAPGESANGCCPKYYHLLRLAFAQLKKRDCIPLRFFGGADTRNSNSYSSGYYCDGSSFYICASSVSSGAVITAAVNLGCSITGTRTATPTSSTITSGADNDLRVFGPMVVLVQGTGENPSYPPLSLSTKSATTSNSPAASSDAAHAKGLSSGAKAAIGVCVPLGVLSVVVGAVLLLLRRRSQHKPIANDDAYDDVDDGDAAEEDNHGVEHGGDPQGPLSPPYSADESGHELQRLR